MNKRGRRGQLDLSFGMIVSIILIIIFLSFGFYAVTKLLNIQKEAQIASFMNDLDSNVEKIWRGGGSERVTYTLPTAIKSICFIDYTSSSSGGEDSNKIYESLKHYYQGDENMFFYPEGSGGLFSARDVKNLDVGKTTALKNPLCITNTRGRVSILTKMGSNESLVTISS